MLLSACFQLYERSLELESFKILDGTSAPDLDLNAPTGTNYQLTPSSTVTIIDPYSDYIAVLKECFDFEALKNFIQKRPDFQMIFDGMHGAGGPFARKVLVEELGLPEVSGSEGKTCYLIPAQHTNCHLDAMVFSFRVVYTDVIRDRTLASVIQIQI